MKAKTKQPNKIDTNFTMTPSVDKDILNWIESNKTHPITLLLIKEVFGYDSHSSGDSIDTIKTKYPVTHLPPREKNGRFTRKQSISEKSTPTRHRLNYETITFKYPYDEYRQDQFLSEDRLELRQIYNPKWSKNGIYMTGFDLKDGLKLKQFRTEIMFGEKYTE